jgi:molybdenum cofactor cytidylyltransferase
LSSANNIGIVILAAGPSSRLGKPKQLLHYKGKNLLQHVVSEAVNSNASPVIVVLGANSDSISKEIDKTKVHVVENKEWREGMASSVRMGLNILQKISPLAEAVIFMVCDQPYVSTSLLNDLINMQVESCKPIVTCNYGEAIGPPALFHKSLFAELMQLQGDAGARKIIQQHSDEVATLLFTKGKIDIDTKEDYEALKNL